jgi:hypothetical protein
LCSARSLIPFKHILTCEYKFFKSALNLQVDLYEPFYFTPFHTKIRCSSYSFIFGIGRQMTS